MVSNPIRACWIAALTLMAAACGGPQETIASQALGEETTDSTAVLSSSSTSMAPATNGEVEAERDWATPSAIVAAMMTPIDIDPPEGVTIESVSVHLSKDAWTREHLTIEVAATSELPLQELACLLSEEPLLPAKRHSNPNYGPCDQVIEFLVHGRATFDLPDHDYFYDWSDPITRIKPTDKGFEIATSTTARRQNMKRGDGLLHTDIAAPLHQAQSIIGYGTGSSGVTWRPSEPHKISANVYFSYLPESHERLTAWVRERSAPGTFDDADGNRAILAGEPPIDITWDKLSYRGSINLNFDYELDDAGIPLANPSMAEGPGRIDLISWGSSWRFDADGVVDDGWQSPQFVGTDWSQGRAPLGRAEAQVTQVPTPDGGLTSWFRREFTVDDASALEWLELEALADDGLVVWLNGTELHRANMPSGPIEPGTFAVDRISGDDELVPWRQAGLPLGGLVDGLNVVAVEVHQAASDSSDIRFDLRLFAS
ncbi:MAG: hypothetical protein ACRBK7_03430 [Acidimicrobiales bacterium]